MAPHGTSWRFHTKSFMTPHGSDMAVTWHYHGSPVAVLIAFFIKAAMKLLLLWGQSFLFGDPLQSNAS